MLLNQGADENDAVFHLQFERISIGADGGRDLIVEAGLVRAERVPFDEQSAEQFQAAVISRISEIDCPFSDEIIQVSEISGDQFAHLFSQSITEVAHTSLGLSLHSLPALENDNELLWKAVRVTQPDYLNPKSIIGQKLNALANS